MTKNFIKNIVLGTRKLLFHWKTFYKTRYFPNISRTAHVPDSVRVLNTDNLYMEEETSIGDDSVIMNPKAKFYMGKYSFTARELLVIDGNHMPIIGMPLIKVTDSIKEQIDVTHKFNKNVVVKEDVWIGARVTLLCGVVVGRGAIIAAGSVVSKNIPPYSIAGGVPAHVIKIRWTKNQILEHEESIYPKEERMTPEQLDELFKSKN